MDVITQRKQGGNLYAAHRQWATRPPDECWKSVEAMDDFCQAQKRASFEKDVKMLSKNLAVVETYDNSDDVVLHVGGQGEAHFTNFSFKQFCTNLRAPADYLSTLPGDLVAQNLNFGIDRALTEDRTARFLYYHAPESVCGDTDGKLFVRAVTSKIYDRLWNADITRWLRKIPPDVMAPPPSRAEQDTGTGLYASDHDMFAFFVAKEAYIDISGAELVRGFYIANNEVGTGAFNICLFLCDYICGNHIIWGLKDSLDIRVRHVSTNATEMFKNALPYAIAASVSAGKIALEQEQRIRAAQQHMLGAKKEDVVNFLFEKRLTTRKLADAAYVSAELRHETTGNCDPNSTWGMVCGLTAEAKAIPFYDERAKVESAATKLLERVAA